MIAIAVRVLSIAGMARRSGILLADLANCLPKAIVLDYLLLMMHRRATKNTCGLRSLGSAQFQCRLGKICGRDSIAFVGVRASAARC